MQEIEETNEAERIEMYTTINKEEKRKIRKRRGSP